MDEHTGGWAVLGGEGGRGSDVWVLKTDKWMPCEFEWLIYKGGGVELFTR